jgi:NTP pyrophosphatase (non-canonical NTP hydrolase)
MNNETPPPSLPASAPSETKPTPRPWEISKHTKFATVGNPNAWAIRKHEFPNHPFEGNLEEEWGIYPPLGESGPVALVAGEANARLILAAVNAHDAPSSPKPVTSAPSETNIPQILRELTGARDAVLALAEFDGMTPTNPAAKLYLVIRNMLTSPGVEVGALADAMLPLLSAPSEGTPEALCGCGHRNSEHSRGAGPCDHDDMPESETHGLCECMAFTPAPPVAPSSPASGDAERGVPLTLAMLREANMTRAKKWHNGTDATFEFRAVELMEEAGEVCGAIKKMARLRNGWKGGKDMQANLAEELGDVVICADLLAMTAGIDLGAAVAAKFNATSEKHGFPERLYTRDDDGVPEIRGPGFDPPLDALSSQSATPAKSIMRENAEKDPAYRPYCLRCPGIGRMSKVENFYWRCHVCGAEHDERSPQSATPAKTGEGEVQP